ncbi:alpha/beta hydrolase [Pseudenhygromyxa sp. WMMC2535]|uniref:alpha/beta hydrolase n=1 Tax=Pseudenhygromyxa sp. WMMC2535 TaxID=2712867 RepID=UPI0031F88641
MSKLQVVEERVHEVVVHEGHRARVRWQLLELVPSDGQPALAVQRTVAAGAEQAPRTRGTVILVHGLAQNSRSWQLSGRSLPAWLAERGYEVLNVDLRGHGLSRRLGSLPARRFDDYADDLVRLVHALPRRPFVAGHSMGAAVAMRAAPRVALAGLVHWAGVYTFARENLALRGAAHLSLAMSGLLPEGAAMSWRPAGRLISRLHRVAEPLNYIAPIRGWGWRSFERPLLRERVTEGFDVTSFAVMEEMSRWALGEPVDDGAFAALEDLPLLVLSGTADKLATVGDGRACYETSRSRDRTFLVFSREVHGFSPGHLDIVLGAKAPALIWPEVLSWLDARA